MSGEIVMHGAQALIKHIEQMQQRIAHEKDRAARSAANVVRRAIRAEARKLRGAGRVKGITKTGRLKVGHELENIRVTRVEDATYRVKPAGRLPHLVIRGVRAHGLKEAGSVMARAMPISLPGGGLVFRPRTTRATTPRPFVADAYNELTRVEAIEAAKVTLAGGPEASET